MDEKDRRYKVMTETTMGWTLIADEAQNLTKEDVEKIRTKELKPK